MADYRRFVAYIYEYTNGRKNKNTGFTKVESRNGICKLQVHLQNIPQDEESINIYGVVREAAWLLGVFLGRVSVKGSSAEIQITTPADGIGDTEYKLEQICGLWIKGLHGGLYITVWDDEPVDIKRFVLELPTRPGSKAAVNSENDLKKADVVDMETMLDQVGDFEQEIVADQEDNLDQGEIADQKDNLDQGEIAVQERESENGSIEQEGEADSESVINQAVETGEKGTENQAKDSDLEGMENKEEDPESEGVIKQGKEFGSDSAVQQKDDPGGEPVLEPEDVSQSDAERKSAEKKTKEVKRDLGMQEAIACPYSDDNCHHPCNRTTSIDRRWQCLSEKYAHMNPFADDEILDCVKIAPKDLSALRQNTWRLGRNSFLMHGYYNYRHILLGKCRRGGYIIAVPGVYENQESFMASMFGFPHFKKAKEQDATGRFGYWYRAIE